MKHLPQISAILLGSVFCAGLLAQRTEEMTLVWGDEFSTDGLPDPSKWSYDVGGHGWGNNELQYYTENRLENARVEGGVLVIEAIKEPFGRTNQYTSARLVSRQKGDWLYGRFEIRAKLPRGRGTWPAIWMLPTDWVYGGWPDSGEIDIMEHVGYDMQRVHGTVHTKDYNHSIGTQVGSSVVASNVDTEFHTYSMEWRPNRIDIFMDGQQYFTFANEGEGFSKWPFDQRFHLILNIAVGGSWGGAQGVDDSIFPQRMEVDYVRVYELADLDRVISHSLPGRVEAEEFSSMSGVRMEATADAGGGSNIGFLGDEDWAEYAIEVVHAGRYAVDVRYASPNGTAGVRLTPEGQNPLTYLLTEPTGGWQSWQTQTIGELELAAGSTRFRLDFEIPGDEDLNLNWLEFRLLDGDLWAGYPVSLVEDQRVANTGNFMGWLNLEADPWLYSYSLQKYLFLPEMLVDPVGGWVFLTH